MRAAAITHDRAIETGGAYRPVHSTSDINAYDFGH
jgi:hypothetical protein